MTQAITWPKKFRSQVVVVNFKTAGMNAEVKNYLANSKMYYNTAVFKSLDATQVALLLSGCVVKIKQKQTSGQIIEKAVPVS